MECPAKFINSSANDIHWEYDRVFVFCNFEFSKITRSIKSISKKKGCRDVIKDTNRPFDRSS